jgi:hypothetical protein
LNSLFVEKPFQGVAPEVAKFIFVGLDANYRADIESHPIFPKIYEYHNDGVSFWQEYKVHHPFLLQEYSGDGRFYHASFARIGFAPRHAQMVSFVELLHVPTTGRSALTIADLDPAHLERVNHWITHGKAEYVFLSSKVKNLMNASSAFPWLPRNPIDQTGALKVLFRAPQKTVYSHLHFSTYGKFAGRKQEEARIIRSFVQEQSGSVP